LFQNTNGTAYVVRDAIKMAKQEVAGVFASLTGAFTSQSLAFAEV